MWEGSVQHLECLQYPLDKVKVRHMACFWSKVLPVFSR
jgi:hypothetical protein